jgi:hypothetical protein
MHLIDQISRSELEVLVKKQSGLQAIAHAVFNDMKRLHVDSIGSECSIDGCHCHHCDAVVGTNQIAIRKKRASLGQDGNWRRV